MSWIHSSKTLVLGLVVVVALGAAGTVVGLDFAQVTAEDELEVGSQAEVEVVIEEPYDGPDEYTVGASTEFVGGSVTITADGPVTTDTETGENPELTVTAEDGYDEIVISASGEVPQIGDGGVGAFSYENPEDEQFTALSVTQNDGPVDTVEIARFTDDSQEARDRIDEAVELAGEDDDDVRGAISLYDSENFEEAITQAQNAIDAEESSEQRSQLLLIGVILLVVVGLAGGGYYVYSQRKQDTNKLQ